MGSSVSNVSQIEGLLRSAQSRLESAKDLKKQRQANGTYKKEPKMWRGSDGVVRNGTDDAIYQAQKSVKEYKAKLAEAKKAAKKK